MDHRLRLDPWQRLQFDLSGSPLVITRITGFAVTIAVPTGFPSDLRWDMLRIGTRNRRAPCNRPPEKGPKRV